MKKGITILVILGLMFFCCKAQYEITYSNNAPELGDELTLNFSTDVIVPSVGESGANVQWDFSQYETASTDELDFVDPDDTPWGDLVSDCNICAYSNDRAQTGEFFNITNNSLVMKYLGTVFNDVSQLTEYSDDYLVMEYPFGFTDDFSDTYAYAMEIDLGGFIALYTSEGTINTTADGWGSIYTPAGYFSDVLRVKSVVVDNYESWYNGELAASGTNIYTHYLWYHASCTYPVMSIDYYEEGSNYANISCWGMSTSIEEYEMQSMNLYPNPVNDLLSVENIPFSIDSYVSIYNSLGKLIKKS